MSNFSKELLSISASLLLLSIAVFFSLFTHAIFKIEDSDVLHLDDYTIENK